MTSDIRSNDNASNVIQCVDWTWSLALIRVWCLSCFTSILSSWLFMLPDLQIDVVKCFNDAEGPQWKHSLFGNPNDPETFRCVSLGFLCVCFQWNVTKLKKMKKKKRSFSGTLTKISMFSVGVLYSDSGRREKEVLENILLENSWNRWCHRNGY